MFANPWTAELLKWSHPMRVSRYVFSGAFNPWMQALARLAEAVERDRRALPAGHPMREAEALAIEAATGQLEALRKQRDWGYERAFELLYESWPPVRTRRRATRSNAGGRRASIHATRSAASLLVEREGERVPALEHV
jgi:hypothetical protein